MKKRSRSKPTRGKGPARASGRERSRKPSVREVSGKSLSPRKTEAKRTGGSAKRPSKRRQTVNLSRGKPTKGRGCESSPPTFKYALPKNRDYKSAFRKYIQVVPKRGRHIVFVIARFEWDRSDPDYRRRYVLPIKMGYMTRAESRRIELGDVERAARIKGIREGFEITQIVTVAALKPRSKRKGVRVFEGAKNGSSSNRKARTRTKRNPRTANRAKARPSKTRNNRKRKR